MQFDEGGEVPREAGKPGGARDRLVAVAVHDALLIVDELEGRNAIDGQVAADIRWAAIRVSGAPSNAEARLFWTAYAELVVLSGRLGAGAAPIVEPSPAQTAPAHRPLRPWPVARYAAIAATLCAIAVIGILPTPGRDDLEAIAVAANEPIAPANLDAARSLPAAAALETEPAYYVAYGRDHPNFPQPAVPPARFDPPQMDM